MPRKPRYSSSSGNDGLFKTIRNFFSGKPISLLDPLSFSGVARPLQDISDPEQSGDAVNKHTLDALTLPDLSDTPDTYTGKGGDFVVVNLSENGITFTPVSDIPHSGLGDLGSDSHRQYALLTGRTGDVLRIDDILEKITGAGVTIDNVLLKDGAVSSNTINERTTGVGVTVDGVLLKDETVSTDTINEKTAGAGVTIDGALVKDKTIKVDGVQVSTTDGALVFKNAAGEEVFRLTKDKQLTTGGETAPDCATGGATLKFASNGMYLTLKTNTSHTFSGIESDTALFGSSVTSAAGSGIAISAIGADTVNKFAGLMLIGYRETMGNWAPICVQGLKNNGSGSSADLSATEKVFEVLNKTMSTRLFEVYGTGIVAMPGQISVLATRVTSSQSIPNNISTAIVFNSESNDNEGCYNTSNGIFTVPVDGTYSVTAWVIFASNATGYRFVTVRKNAGSLKGVLLDACSSERTFLNVSDTLIGSAGDTLDICVIQTSGGALNVAVGSEFSITKIT